MSKNLIHIWERLLISSLLSVSCASKRWSLEVSDGILNVLGLKLGLKYCRKGMTHKTHSDFVIGSHMLVERERVAIKW